MAASTTPCVLVTGLTRNVRAAHLSEIFGFYGSVADVRVDFDARCGLPRGTAIVEFESPADADEAVVRLAGAQLDGAVISVSLAHEERARARPPAAAAAEPAEPAAVAAEPPPPPHADEA
jgi:RNA-binding protein with serine-rich domain 1